MMDRRGKLMIEYLHQCFREDFWSLIISGLWRWVGSKALSVEFWYFFCNVAFTARILDPESVRIIHSKQVWRVSYRFEYK